MKFIERNFRKNYTNFFNLNSLEIQGILRKHCPWGNDEIGVNWIYENPEKLVILIDTPSHGGYLLISTIRLPQFEGLLWVSPLKEKNLFLYFFEEDCDALILLVTDRGVQEDFLKNCKSYSIEDLAREVKNWGIKMGKLKNFLLPNIVECLEKFENVA